MLVAGRLFWRDDKGDKVNPTQKNLLLMDFLIRHHSKPGDTVASLCDGSGTTTVSALRLGRNVIGVDQDPVMLAEARRRAVTLLAEEKAAIGADVSVTLEGGQAFFDCS